MRIVGVADTHLFHESIRIPEGDVLVHAGDLCRAGVVQELEEAARWLASFPHRIKVVVAGNHDWCLQCEPDRARDVLRGFVYLEDSSAVIEGVRFYGSPWQPDYNEWAFNLPRGEALAKKWALVPPGVDVLVTHSPPEGLGDRGPIEGRQGCADLLRRVTDVKPRLHLFGHIHQDGGFWRRGETAFANVTTWEGERAPTVIDLDPRTGEVVPVSIPPAGA